MKLVNINGLDIPVRGMHARLVTESDIFKRWVERVSGEYSINWIDVDSVFFSNSPQSEPKFIQLKVNISNKLGEFTYSISMRGSSVAILVVLECKGEEYTLLTLQPRLPTGMVDFPEIPAGSVDDSGSFVGVAVRELEEETGITIKMEDLLDMTELVYGDRFKGVFTSPGGSDEFVRIFLYHQLVDEEFLNGLRGKSTGLVDEHESITLEVIKLSDLPFRAPDCKTLSAIVLYNLLKKQGIV